MRTLWRKSRVSSLSPRTQTLEHFGTLLVFSFYQEGSKQGDSGSPLLLIISPSPLQHSTCPTLSPPVPHFPFTHLFSGIILRLVHKSAWSWPHRWLDWPWVWRADRNWQGICAQVGQPDKPHGASLRRWPQVCKRLNWHLYGTCMSQKHCNGPPEWWAIELPKGWRYKTG